MIYWLAIKKFLPYLGMLALLGSLWWWFEGEKKEAYLEGRHEVQSLWDAQKDIDSQAEREANDQHAAERKVWEDQLLATKKGYDEKLKIVESRAARADSDLIRVRNALAKATSRPSSAVPLDPGASCGAHDQYVSFLAGIVSTGAGLLADLRRRIDELEAKVTGLQELVRGYTLQKATGHSG